MQGGGGLCSCTHMQGGGGLLEATLANTTPSEHVRHESHCLAALGACVAGGRAFVAMRNESGAAEAHNWRRACNAAQRRADHCEFTGNKMLHCAQGMQRSATTSI
jgi:hypothetical protein